MLFNLMHKDVAVVDMNLDSQGNLSKVHSISSFEHMPYGTCKGGFLDSNSFKEWWSSRSIPASRSGLDDFLTQLNVKDIKPLIVKSAGLSLSDHYWIRPDGTDIGWKDINFFDNDFSDDIGDMLFGHVFKKGEIDLISPDNTSDGVLKKRWKIINGRRCLIKGGTAPYFQEPFNEVAASRIMDLLDVPHVRYDIIDYSDSVYSICEDMVDRSTELIPAARVHLISAKRNDMSNYEHYLSVCRGFGLDVRRDLDMMLLVDYLICNRDRHYSNFGIIRNPDSLEWISSAPVYDSGSSLGSDTSTELFSRGFFEKCKPFARTFEEQWKYISSVDWVEREALHCIPSVLDEVFSESNGWLLSERRNAIIKLVESRIDKIDELLRS